MKGLLIKLTILLFILMASASYAEEETVYLSLDNAVKVALLNNLDIKLAELEAKIAGTDVRLAEAVFDTIVSGHAEYTKDESKRSSIVAGTKSQTTDYAIGVSKKLPTGTEIGMDLSSNRSWQNSAFVTMNPAHESKAEFSITQPVGKNFFGMIDRGDIQMAKIYAQMADLDSLDSIEESIAETEKAYWNLVLAYKDLEVKRKMLDRAEELLKVTVDKLDRGLAEDTDLYAVKANQKLRLTDVLVAEDDVKSAINELKLQLNDRSETKIVPTEKLEAEEIEVDLVAALREAFEYRRDYNRTVKDIDAKKIQVKLKRNSLWPEIDLEASFSRNGLDTQYNKAVRNIFNEYSPTYYLGVKFSLALENNLARGELSRAQFEKAKALIELQKTEHTIITEIDDKVRAALLNMERAKQQLKVEELQGLKLKGEEKKFKYGRSNIATVIDYQEDLLEAQILSTEALVDYQNSLVDLELAKNTLLSKVGVDRDEAR